MIPNCNMFSDSSEKVKEVSTDFAVGTPRVSFALFDGEVAAENVASVELQLSYTRKLTSGRRGLEAWSML